MIPPVTPPIPSIIPMVEGAAAFVTLLVAIGGALYVRGGLDNHAKLLGDKLKEHEEATTASIDKVDSRLKDLEENKVKDAEARGAQRVYNDTLRAVEEGLASNRMLVSAIEARQNAHESDCERIRREEGRRAERIENSVLQIFAQLRNIAQHTAGAIVMLPGAPAEEEEPKRTRRRGRGG